MQELFDGFEIAPGRVGRGQLADDKPARHRVAVEPGAPRFCVEHADLAFGTDHAAGDAQRRVGLAAARRPVELDQQMCAGAFGGSDIEDTHLLGPQGLMARKRSAERNKAGSGEPGV